MQRHHIALAIGALFFAWFVWPTPYRYVGFIRDQALCRINVFTDQVSCLNYTGWFVLWE